jgi:hypothetical protein
MLFLYIDTVYCANIEYYVTNKYWQKLIENDVLVLGNCDPTSLFKQCLIIPTCGQCYKTFLSVIYIFL